MDNHFQAICMINMTEHKLKFLVLVLGVLFSVNCSEAPPNPASTMTDSNVVISPTIDSIVEPAAPVTIRKQFVSLAKKGFDSAELATEPKAQPGSANERKNQSNPR